MLDQGVMGRNFRSLGRARYGETPASKKSATCWIFLQCLWSESWMPVLWLRANSTFTFFGILSEIETFIVSSTKSVEATTSRDPVKGTDFLTC